MTSFTRRTLTFAALSTPLFAQSAMPKGTITLVVPFAAGGATDITARIVAKKFTEQTGLSMVVENVGGAGGGLGATKVAKANNDGNTLLMGTISTHVVIPLMAKTPPYDPVKDFTPISNLTVTPNVLIANKAFPPNTVTELLAYLKANPSKVSYASSGIGSILHLSGEMLKAQAGVDMVHVPYRGSGPAMADLISGQIQLSFDVISSAGEQIKGGNVKAIGLAHKSRSPAYPTLPTFIEQGLPQYESFTWNGIFAPPNTPKPIADALTTAFKAVMADTEVKTRLTEMGAFVEGTSGEELQKFFEGQLVTFKPIIEAAGLRQ